MVSEKIDLLAAALCSFQSELQDVEKNSENPFFKSSYADLSAIWGAVRPLLSKHGLAVSQIGDGTNLKTLLIHNSGQFIEGSIALLTKDQTMQSLGSAISYARRYGLSAILGVSQKDDDGNEASHSNIHSKVNVPISPGDVVVPFGKDKGRKIKELPDIAHRENLKYWKQRLEKDHKQPDGALAMFLEATEAWLEQAMEEDIPQ